MSIRLLFFISLFSVPLCAVLGHDHGTNAVQSGLEFHENKGQWPDQVLYRARTNGGAMFVEKGGFTYVVSSGGEHLTHGLKDAKVEPLITHAFNVKFQGAAMHHQGGFDRRSHYVNYFLGNDPAKWGTGAAVFGGATMFGMYPGIDLHVDGSKGLKYDWLVAAHADPAVIVMKYSGQDDIRVEGGMLFIGTQAGRVIEQRPVAWQEIHGTKRSVACRYVLEDDRVHFEFPDGYDPRYELVIDPVVIFSSYSGSNADNFGLTATYDAAGHLYGGGSAFGIGYPTTVGIQQAAFGGGTVDMGISKFSADGSSLVWSTYVGGNGQDLPHSMVVNSQEELFIFGTTSSTNFPVTIGCYDNSFNNGTPPPFGGSYGFTYANGCDVAVVHLNANATALVGATYVGGSGNDGLNQFTPLLRNYGDPFRGEIILDQNEDPIVATSTTSPDMFTTPGAIQSTFGGGLDAYIFRMDNTLSTMLWATYYGGSSNDAGFGVQTASNGEIFMTGGTQSSDLQMVGPSAQPAIGGNVDGYIARFDADGTALMSSTFLGTPSFDQSYFVQLDQFDNVYVVGQTTGAYPVSPGRYNNPNGMQFIQKFSNDLGTSLWSTRIGSTGQENISPSAFLVSICGQIYFSGWGGSTNPAGGGVSSSSTMGLPVTSDAYQPNTDGSDFYLMVLDQDAVSLAYATFFGGSAAEHVDGGTSRFDKDGIVYQAVCAGCGGQSFPTTPGAYSNSNNSFNCNLGVFKIDFEQGVHAAIDASTTDGLACLGSPLIFNAVGNALFWTWDFGDGSPQENGVQVSHEYTAVGTYQVMLIGSDTASCNGTDTALVSVNIIQPFDLQPQFNAVPSSDCQGYSAEFFNLTLGPVRFIWQFGDGLTSSQTNPVHPYQGPGDYDVVLTVIDTVCADTVTLTQRITLDPPSDTLDLESPVALCDGASALLNAGDGFNAYLWSTGATTSAISVQQPGMYWVTITDGVCTASDTIEVIMQPSHPPSVDILTCPGVIPYMNPSFVPTSILWSNGDTTITSLASGGGTYTFIATDQYGCVVRDTIVVTLVPNNEGIALVPNVFSPNGDGKNDSFKVTGLAVDEFSMVIYNRWGQEVYAGTNASVGWNGGVDNSANKVPDGTYFYIITFKDRCSTPPVIEQKGHVTLVR